MPYSKLASKQALDIFKLYVGRERLQNLPVKIFCNNVAAAKELSYRLYEALAVAPELAELKGKVKISLDENKITIGNKDKARAVIDIKVEIGGGEDSQRENHDLPEIDPLDVINELVMNEAGEEKFTIFSGKLSAESKSILVEWAGSRFEIEELPSSIRICRAPT